MTRFNISLNEAVKTVDWAINNSLGGEIIVPKTPSYRLIDLAKAVNPKSKLKVIGLRKGEKIHEEMITSGDSLTTYDIGKFYFILTDNNAKLIKKFKNKFPKLKKVNKNFTYNSKENNKFLTVSQLRKMIKNAI